MRLIIEGQPAAFALFMTAAIKICYHSDINFELAIVIEVMELWQKMPCKLNCLKQD